MGKRSNLILIMAIIMLIMPIYLYFKCETKTVLENNKVRINDGKALSIMYETKSGSGEYIVSDDTTWPGDGYIFNEEKSNCQNGSKLIWDDEVKTVSVKVDNSDKCYVYFDKEITLGEVCQGQNMASCIAAYYKLDNSIIYHNGTTRDATYGVIDAEDNSYRYSGASESVKNFVCFGSDAITCPNDNLYRIIGVFGNQVKLIKYDYALTNLLGTNGEYKYSYIENVHETSYYRGPTDVTIIPGYLGGSLDANDWATSKLNTVNLNTNYISNIGDDYADKIANTTWKIGGMTGEQGILFSNIAKTAYNYELGTSSIDKTCKAKIGLMYLSDYYYAASPTYWTYYGYNESDATKDYRASTGANWMYMGLAEWSMTRFSDVIVNEFFIQVNGYGSSTFAHGIGFGIRPCFYLESSTILSGGSGTMTDPYRIS